MRARGAWMLVALLAGACRLGSDPVAVARDFSARIWNEDCTRALGMLARSRRAAVDAEASRRGLAPCRTSSALGWRVSRPTAFGLVRSSETEAEILATDADHARFIIRVVKEQGAWKVDAFSME